MKYFEKLYVDNPKMMELHSPIILGEIAIIKDTVDNEVLLRNTFVNISDENIIAAKIMYQIYDIFGEELHSGDGCEYSYLDNIIIPGIKYGNTIPILLPQNARRVSVNIRSVVFESGRIWNCNSEEIIEIPDIEIVPNDRMKCVFEESSLEEDQIFYFAKTSNAWLCCCGEINSMKQEICCNCKRKYSDVESSFSKEDIEEKYVQYINRKAEELRLEKERQKLEEEKRKQLEEEERRKLEEIRIQEEKEKAALQKKKNKNVAIIACIIVACIAIAWPFLMKYQREAYLAKKIQQAFTSPEEAPTDDPFSLLGFQGNFNNYKDGKELTFELENKYDDTLSDNFVNDMDKLEDELNKEYKCINKENRAWYDTKNHAAVFLTYERDYELGKSDDEFLKISLKWIPADTEKEAEVRVSNNYILMSLYSLHSSSLLQMNSPYNIFGFSGVFWTDWDNLLGEVEWYDFNMSIKCKGKTEYDSFHDNLETILDSEYERLNTDYYAWYDEIHKIVMAPCYRKSDADEYKPYLHFGKVDTKEKAIELGNSKNFY